MSRKVKPKFKYIDERIKCYRCQKRGHKAINCRSKFVSDQDHPHSKGHPCNKKRFGVVTLLTHHVILDGILIVVQVDTFVMTKINL